jgi:hypothetical protein
MLKKGRIVQFEDGSYAYQRVLFGFIPLQLFLDFSFESIETWYNIPYDTCKRNSLESLKEAIKKIENYKNPRIIKRVVKETELEKALE